MFDGTEATIDHTKSQVGYKSIVWFGHQLGAPLTLSYKKFIYHTRWMQKCYSQLVV